MARCQLRLVFSRSVSLDRMKGGSGRATKIQRYRIRPRPHSASLGAFKDIIVYTCIRCPDPDEAVSTALPDLRATPPQVAQWLANRHFSSITAIELDVYGPTSSPMDGIHPLEENRFLNRKPLSSPSYRTHSNICNRTSVLAFLRSRS